MIKQASGWMDGNPRVIKKRASESVTPRHDEQLELAFMGLGSGQA